MANFLLIRELCELKKITIRELASRIGKEDSSIQAIVRNGSTNTKTIEAIAKVLEVPVGVFFDDIPITGIKSNELDKDAKIADLERIIEEKERLIQVLLSKKLPVIDKKCRHIVGYTIMQIINNQAIKKRYLNHK